MTRRSRDWATESARRIVQLTTGLSAEVQTNYLASELRLAHFARIDRGGEGQRRSEGAGEAEGRAAVRSVPEWRGKTDDTPVPTRVKLRILHRQDDRCAGILDDASRCSVIFTAHRKPDFDHRPALANGGENREAKIFALCEPCHDKLYPGDMAEKSKTNDMKAKHLGLKKSAGRGFQTNRDGKFKKHMDGRVSIR